MDLNALNTFRGFNAASQYAAPFCYELCGKSFVIMRGLKYGDNVFPGITISEYPEKTVSLDGEVYPYYAAKITDDLVFAGFMAGDEAYAGVFDINKSLTPEQMSKRTVKLRDPERPVSTSFFVNLALNANNDISFGPLDAEGGDELLGNVIEWVFAQDSPTKFDYSVEDSPLKKTSDFRRTKITEGIYMQTQPITEKIWMCVVMDFNKVLATGMMFGNGQDGVFCQEIGGYGKVLVTE